MALLGRLCTIRPTFLGNKWSDFSVMWRGLARLDSFCGGSGLHHVQVGEKGVFTLCLDVISGFRVVVQGMVSSTH